MTTQQSMIERISRALWLANQEDGSPECYEIEARAVLTAMRDCSDAMLKAVTYVDAMDATKRAIWQEMCAAALRGL